MRAPCLLSVLAFSLALTACGGGGDATVLHQGVDIGNGVFEQYIQHLLRRRCHAPKACQLGAVRLAQFVQLFGGVYSLIGGIGHGINNSGQDSGQHYYCRDNITGHSGWFETDVWFSHTDDYGRNRGGWNRHRRGSIQYIQSSRGDTCKYYHTRNEDLGHTTGDQGIQDQETSVCWFWNKEKQLDGKFSTYGI